MKQSGDGVDDDVVAVAANICKHSAMAAMRSCG